MKAFALTCALCAASYLVPLLIRFLRSSPRNTKGRAHD